MLNAGVALTRFWNGQGEPAERWDPETKRMVPRVRMPEPGQQYLLWWRKTREELESPLNLVPDYDLAEEFDRQAEIARRWHAKHNQVDDPPVFWSPPEGIVPKIGVGLGAGAALAVVAVVLIFALRR